MSYLNLSRRGVRSTTTVNPQSVMRDISEKARRLSPTAMPLMNFLLAVGKGRPAGSKKVETRRRYAFDHLDHISAATAGTAGPPDQRRFGRLTVDQISRPYSSGQMYYQPQDKFYIMETGQVVEVVMTPDAAYQVNGSDLTLTAGLTGNTTTRSAAGTVVVRCIEPVNFIAPTSSDFYYMGRTIWESQPVETQGYQNDDVYDFNFVEHKELTIEATNDQLEYINLHGKFNDFSELQAEALEQFKTDIDLSCMWGERSLNMDQSNRPTYHMRGLINAIQTNVMTYSPTSTVDMENLISEWMYKQVFRYQGSTAKVVYAGAGWINNFNKAFREFRRVDGNIQKLTPGLNVTSYEWMNYKIHIVRSELFRMGTAQEHWAVAFDPSVIEPRINKNFTTFDPTLPNERVKKWTVEWAGTISFHLEEHLALMRTP